MIFRSPAAKRDLIQSWGRPDRPFFASGACHILAGVFLEKYADANYRPFLFLRCRASEENTFSSPMMNGALTTTDTCETTAISRTTGKKCAVSFRDGTATSRHWKIRRSGAIFAANMGTGVRMNSRTILSRGRWPFLCAFSHPIQAAHRPPRQKTRCRLAPKL
jgi:hypothetical protein